MGKLAVWSSALALWVAGVAGQTAAPAAGGLQGLVAGMEQAAMAVAKVAEPAGQTMAPIPVLPSAPATTMPPGTFNPMAPDPAVAAGQPAVSAAMNAAMQGNQAGMAALAPAAIAQAPAATGNFVDGFIRGYFAKVSLETGEKECITRNVNAMTRDGVGIITQIAQFIATMVAKGKPNAMGIMGAAGQAVEIVTTTQTLIKGCVQADAMAVMTKSLEHLKNPDYVQGRLLANGIDIANVTADAIPAWQTSNFLQVGIDFGTLMRKILLSGHTGPISMILPAGMTKTQVYQAVVNGVVEGLFADGTSMTITDSVDPSVHVFVDLHKCIAEEAPYFSAAINVLYAGITQMVTSIQAAELASKGVKTGYISPGGTTIGAAANQQAAGPAGGMEANYMGQLSGLMTNLPVLLTRCGMTQEQRIMMSEALKNMANLGVAFNIPGPQDRVQAGNQAAIKFEQATAAWKEGRYHDFGILLGDLMRDLLLVIYPQQYHVAPATGRLYRTQCDKQHMIDMSEPATRGGSLALSVAGFSAVALVGLSAFRMVRPSARPTSLLAADNDVEAHGTDTAVE